ncbi:hypothetical protein Pd630_LPD10062 (plasmid) [Rhodococcus opacus PD630]|nr:hypothetical protein Pd630_LPD10062 [Rhodococcus opacus PD630]
MRPDRATDDKTREFERISHQVVANDQREDLTAGDRAEAVAEMLELGFSVAKVAKAVSMPREQVKANGTIGQSKKAREAFESGQLDMERAAILAEFEVAGDTDAVDELMSNRWNFRYTAEKLRNDRAEKAERAEAAQRYVDRGYAILAEEPDYGRDLLLPDLLTAEGGAVTEADTETDPNKWAVWLTKEERYVGAASGQELDGATGEWGNEEEEEGKQEEGEREGENGEGREGRGGGGGGGRGRRGGGAATAVSSTLSLLAADRAPARTGESPIPAPSASRHTYSGPQPCRACTVSACR